MFCWSSQRRSSLKHSNSFDLVIYASLYIFEYTGTIVYIRFFFLTVRVSLDIFHKLCHFGTEFHVHNMNHIPHSWQICYFSFTLNLSRFCLVFFVRSPSYSKGKCSVLHFGQRVLLLKGWWLTMEKREVHLEILLRLPWPLVARVARAEVALRAQTWEAKWELSTWKRSHI